MTKYALPIMSRTEIYLGDEDFDVTVMELSAKAVL